jgi:hypothetical protein
MTNTLTIVHAPGTNSMQTQVLEKKLESIMKELNICQENVLINLDPGIDLEAIEKSENPRTLIIGWGLSKEPCWTPWIYALKTSTTINRFIAIDLYDRHEKTRRLLMDPDIKTGRYWRHKSWETQCKLFLKGCWVSHVTPYGMQRRPTMDPFTTGYTGINRHRLSPGLPPQTEIVRLIFSLFADHDYTMTEISNLLNAQGIDAPHNSNFWNIKKVKTILESIVYIGSNSFGACLNHNVFPPLLDRSIFCAALSKIHGK